MLAVPPPAVAPATPGRVDYRCADGRRMLVLFRADAAVVRIEHEPLLVLAAASAPRGGPVYAGARTVFQQFGHAPGPFVLTRTPQGAALVSPGWPPTTCRP